MSNMFLAVTESPNVSMSVRHICYNCTKALETLKFQMYKSLNFKVSSFLDFRLWTLEFGIC